MVEADRAIIREMRIGDIRVQDVEALIMPPGAMRGSLMGMSFLSRLKSFQIVSGRLVLKG